MQWVTERFSDDKAVGSVKLTTHFHLVQRLKMHSSTSPLHHTFHGVVLN
jgi:hypothetical protein